MTLPLLRSLLAHADWANARVLAALHDVPDADPQVLALFSHLLAAERVWLARIAGEPAGISVWPNLTADECAALARDNAAAFARLLDGESEATLTRELTYATSTGQPFANRVVDILAHVVMHGAYHRGQVAWLLRRGGAPPPPTDYIVYVRSGDDAPRDVSAPA